MGSILIGSIALMIWPTFYVNISSQIDAWEISVDVVSIMFGTGLHLACITCWVQGHCHILLIRHQFLLILIGTTEVWLDSEESLKMPLLCLVPMAIQNESPRTNTENSCRNQFVHYSAVSAGWAGIVAPRIIWASITVCMCFNSSPPIGNMQFYYQQRLRPGCLKLSCKKMNLILQRLDSCSEWSSTEVVWWLWSCLYSRLKYKISALFQSFPQAI